MAINTITHVDNKSPTTRDNTSQNLDSVASRSSFSIYLCCFFISLFLPPPPSLSLLWHSSTTYIIRHSLNANVRNLFWQQGSEIGDKIDVNSHLARSSRRWLLPGGSPSVSLFHAPLTLSRLSLTFLLFPLPKLRVYPFVQRREHRYKHVRTDDATKSNGSYSTVAREERRRWRQASG